MCRGNAKVDLVIGLSRYCVCRRSWCFRLCGLYYFRFSGLCCLPVAGGGTRVFVRILASLYLMRNGCLFTRRCLGLRQRIDETKNNLTSRRYNNSRAGRQPFPAKKAGPFFGPAGMYPRLENAQFFVSDQSSMSTHWLALATE